MDVDELIGRLSAAPQVKYWRFDTSHDGKCCARCHGFRGRVFSNNDPAMPKLPLHPNCRCSLVEIAPADLTGNLPNARYIINDAAYDTDGQGRVKKAATRLKDVPEKRNRRNQKTAAQMGKPGDDGGHLIPARYGGSGKLINHLPQSRNANRSLIKKVENEMGKAVKQGKHVEYTVVPHYPNEKTLRPDRFKIRCSIDGVQNEWSIPND